MYYYPEMQGDPVHPNYRSYANPISKQILDEPENIVIVPELASTIRLFSRFHNIQKVIWWLSVNNFVASTLPYAHMGLVREILFRFAKFVYRSIVKRLPTSHGLRTKALAIRLFGDRESSWEEMTNNKELMMRLMKALPVFQANLHLCQSYYALEFLSSLRFSNVAYLSDYLSDDFLRESVDVAGKEDIVAFSPSKGWAFTWRVMRAAPHLRFESIYGLSRRGVVELLRRAKVYIDFGSHPGKDRLPREAAILGCCIVVGKRGSARNEYDVPIPQRYKFAMDERNVSTIVCTIEECVKGYEAVVREFEPYREWIRREPEIFRNCVRKIFG